MFKIEIYVLLFQTLQVGNTCNCTIVLTNEDQEKKLTNINYIDLVLATTKMRKLINRGTF